jgi:hypothetical protein
VLGVERVHHVTVYVDQLAGGDLADPPRQVLIRVGDVVHDDRHRPGISVGGEGRRAPLLLGASLYEADQPVSGRVDLRSVGRRGERIFGHDRHFTDATA